jgi:hypothetical protein
VLSRFDAVRASPAAIVAATMLCAVAADVRAVAGDLQQLAGTVSGIVVDDVGSPIADATIVAEPAAGSRVEAMTGANGRFSLPNIAPGPVDLAVSARGFADRVVSAAVVSGEVTNLPPIRLRIAVNAGSIDVTPTVEQIADEQIKQQEQQRVLGIVPNYFVSFLPDAAPLNTRQKFHLSWKARTDPTQFAFVAVVAAVQQSRDDYSGFGDGVSGYGRRYAAAYASAWTSSLMNRVVMPAVFRQDPRYFYKGTGSPRSRVAYALSRSVVRKGDNGRWQPNYSGVLGSIASGAISNFYYPAEDRRGLRLTVQNAAVAIAGSAVGHLAQEFVAARMTSRGRPSP